MKLRIDCGKKKWWILILVHATYLTFQLYTWALWIPFVFDFLFNFWLSDVFLIDQPLNQQPVESIVLDLFIRIMVILLGATINGLVSWVYDLSFFEGNPYLYLGVLYFIYVCIMLLHTRAYGADIWIFEFGRGGYPEIKQKTNGNMDKLTKKEREKLRAETKRPWTDHADYLFLLFVFAFTLMFRDIFIFAEPYTYFFYFGYILTVLIMVIIIDFAGTEWQPVLTFLLFWYIGVIAIGSAILVDKSEHKHDISEYFK